MGHIHIYVGYHSNLQVTSYLLVSMHDYLISTIFGWDLNVIESKYSNTGPKILKITRSSFQFGRIFGDTSISTPFCNILTSIKFGFQKYCFYVAQVSFWVSFWHPKPKCWNYLMVFVREAIKRF